MTDQDTKRAKIGPDGKFAFGKPINAIDQGGLYAGFRVMPSPPWERSFTAYP